MKIKIMKNTILLFLILLVIVGCAQQQDLGECLKGEPESFFPGLVHGLISPIAFVGMLMGDDVTIYSPNNDGKWYALGFIIGTGGFTKLIDFIKDLFRDKKVKKSTSKD